MNLVKSAMILFLLLIKVSIFGQQLEVTPSTISPYTPENLISNIFLGNGVEIISINFRGVPLAVGYFQDAMNEIGLERGIFLSTGEAVQVTEPQSFSSTSPTSLFTYTDDDLFGLLPPSSSLTLLDIASYEITFVPKSDKIEFEYVFASEEYPEYVCSQFNDVFGFFISGPNPMGGTYNSKNIALIPGTNTPVAINNVNNGNSTLNNCPASNPQFFNDNNLSTTFVFDGYTDVFTASADVIPCQTYTIKIAITDVDDEVQDSGVFLKAKSFGSNTLSLDALTAKADRTIVEGCSSADIIFSLPSNVDADVVIDFTLVGTAQNTLDISTIPNQVTILQGNSDVHLTIDALEDGLDEGIESLGFAIEINSCTKDTLWINIRDFILDDVNLPDTIVICPNESTILDANLNTPFQEDLVFENTNNLILLNEKEPYLSEIEVTGVLPKILHPDIIKEICIDSLSHPILDQIDAFIIGPNGQFVELTTDNGEDGGNGTGPDYYLHTCFTPTSTQPIDNNNPNGAPASEIPFTNKYAPEGYFTDLWDGDYNTNGTWKLHLTDDTNVALGTLHSWSIAFNGEYSYQYQWTADPTLSCLDCPNPVATPTETTTYYFSIDDSYGCNYTDSVVVIVGGEIPDFTINCINTTNTEITFAWDDPGPNIKKEINIDGQGWVMITDNSYTVTGLSSGQSINASVRFSNDCSTKVSLITCTTGSCPEITINEINKKDPLCLNDTNGSIEIAIVEAGNYVFQLGTEINTTGVFSNLAEGNYTIIIKDDQNCNYEYQFTLIAPPMLEAIITVTKPISCNGENDGVLQCTMLNGTFPYTYNWNTGSLDDTTTTGAGMKSVSVVDANGCKATAIINFEEPEPFTVQIAIDHLKCFEDNSGSATSFVTGGTSPYSYLWSDTSTNDTNSNLSAGNIALTVTDANNCEAIATDVVNQPDPIIAMINVTDATCSSSDDGTATVTITSGGTAPFSYKWSNSTSTSSNATELPFGDFSVTITDTNSCEHVINSTITSPNPLQYSIDKVDISCFEGNDGSITITPSGGMPNYKIKWDNDAVNQSINGLSSGSYTFTITDDNDCTISETINLIQPDPIKIDVLSTHFECNDSMSGIIEIEASGGTGNLMYLWDTNETDPIIFNQSSGIHTVTVTDENDCKVSHVIDLESANPMSIFKDNEGISCFGDSNGVATISVSGGTDPFSVQWDNGSQEFSNTGLGVGQYFVTITDSEGCTKIESIEILGPDPLLINPEVFQPICNNDKNGNITLTPQGGTSPYLFSLNNGNFISESTFSQLQSGNYSCLVKDDNNCETSFDFEIINPQPIALDIQADSILEYGNSTILESSVQNATGTVKYTWLVDSIISMPCRDCPNPEVSPLTTTTYHLLVQDENGCLEEDYITVRVILDTELFYPTAITPDGNGSNDIFYIFGKHESVQSINNFMILDRWGEIMFQNKDLVLNNALTGWDGKFHGKPAQSGVYVFVLDVTFINGEHKLIDGDFVILR